MFDVPQNKKTIGKKYREYEKARNTLFSWIRKLNILKFLILYILICGLMQSQSKL